MKQPILLLNRIERSYRLSVILISICFLFYCLRSVQSQTCETYSSFSASIGICMCEFAGGVLKVPKAKCCSSVLTYLQQGCDGTPDPAKVARIIDPMDPTLYYCAEHNCVDYNGNGGDICVKSGAKMRLPCCDSVNHSLYTLCADGLDRAKVAKIIDPRDTTLYYCGGGASCHAYDGDGGDICAIAGSRPHPRPPCCASLGDFVATGCADIDGFRLGTMLDPGDNSVIACAVENCDFYQGNGSDLCPKVGGVVRPPCCASVAGYMHKSCVGIDPGLVAKIVDPNDNSLFVCAREGRDCFTYSGSYGASVDVCLLGGGVRKLPCCGSVADWINTGCYSVDSILFSRVVDSWDTTLYDCANDAVSDDCREYDGNGQELCPLVGGVVKPPCCDSIGTYIAAACVDVDPDRVAKITDPADRSLLYCGSNPLTCYPYMGRGGDLCALASGYVRQQCCSSLRTFIEANCSGYDKAKKLSITDPADDSIYHCAASQCFRRYSLEASPAGPGGPASPPAPTSNASASAAAAANRTVSPPSFSAAGPRSSAVARRLSLVATTAAVAAILALVLPAA